MTVSYLTIGGDKHPMVFSLGASEEISDAFGGLGAMADILSGGNESEKFHALGKVTEILLKYGRMYAGEVLREEVPPPLKYSPMVYIGVDEVAGLVESIFRLIKSDGNTEIKLKPGKNGAPTPAG